MLGVRRITCMGLIVIGLVCQMFLIVPADATPPVDVASAAQEGIKTFAKLFSSQDFKANANVTSDLDKAFVGEGFQVFTIPPDRLLSANASDSFNSLAMPSTIWEFLVMTDGKATGIVTVDRMNGVWKAVSFGKAGLAKQLEAGLKAWPAGYQLRLIRIYQAMSDFIEVSSADKILGVVPLTSAKAALSMMGAPFNPADIQNDGDMVTKLIPIVRKNLLNAY